MNPNLPRFEHMLRSRTRGFGFPSPSERPDDSILEKSKNPRRPGQLFSVFDTGFSTIYKILILSVTLGAIIFILFWPETTIVLQAASPPASTLLSFTTAPPARPRLVPLVDRSILQRLADLEVSPDPDERPYFTSSPQQRPAMVTRIPEARKPLDPFIAPDICSTPGTPCRFLLPLRIGEQESKARVHLMEIMQLAQRLDRILVLPNVGKSRIGMCFKSGLETYYDLERLTDDLELPVATVKLDLFRHWVNANAPSAQLGSLSFRQESHLGVDAVTFSNEDVSIRVGSFDSTLNLPGCLAKFSALRLDAHAPLHIHLKPHTHTRPIAASIVDALTRPDIQAAAASFPPSTSESESPDPAVLILTWDLRTPIFPFTAHRPTLHYAPRLHALAATLAPRAPYAMVYWRMESVAPARLPQCAHALVDTLTRLGGVRTVWLASDYPHAMHRSRGDIDFGATGGGVAPEAKSGTFRNVGPLHAEAVGILGDAFVAGGELEGWAVAQLTGVELAAALDGDWDWEPELLEDAGVRAIVEKLIGMRAAVFVSGAPGCTRTSSFTQEVVDERRNVLDRLNYGDELPILQNVIELFG